MKNDYKNRCKKQIKIIFLISAITYSFIAFALAQPGEIKFSAAGDVMLGRHVAELMDAKSPHYPFEKISSYLKTRDLAFCNLETAISVNGTHKNKKYYFKAAPAHFEGLKNSGFNMFSLGNNHTLDYGPVALRDTVKLLDEAGFYHAGAGPKGTEKEFTYIQKNGLTVAFMAATDLYVAEPGDEVFTVYDALKDAPLAPRIKAAAKKADVVIVSLHWGKEYSHYPEEYMKKIARACVDAGADLVIGHHPHVLQGVEKYKGAIILYSLGNFVFDQREEKQKESCLFSCTLTKDGVKEPFIQPVVVEDFIPGFAKGNAAKKINKSIKKYSTPFGTVFDEKDGKLFIK